jgi:outer membrane protein assembly factor BamD (BamD/ComL family)
MREQIALLDRARAALRSGHGGAALTELDTYRKRFPRGEFAQEVSVLKIEALVQNGQMDSARTLGKRFLAAHPESPHVERIERLIGAAR